MINDLHQKVQASHLKRDAYLYVRQSTLRQVFENTESTKRQYGLGRREGYCRIVTVLLHRLGGEQYFQGTQVKAMQGIDIGHPYAFVHLVDGGINDTQFNHLCAHGRDESPVGGAAARR